MRITLGKILRFVLDRLKGKIVKVGGLEVELQTQPGPKLKNQSGLGK